MKLVKKEIIWLELSLEEATWLKDMCQNRLNSDEGEDERRIQESFWDILSRYIG